MFLADGLLDKLQPYLPTLILLIGMGTMIFMLMRRNSAVQREGGDSSQEVRKVRSLHAERDRDSSLADAPEEVLRWQVEMHNIARETKAEIDTKLMLLQTLLKEVREERERLEELLANRKDG